MARVHVPRDKEGVAAGGVSECPAMNSNVLMEHAALDKTTVLCQILRLYEQSLSRQGGRSLFALSLFTYARA